MVRLWHEGEWKYFEMNEAVPIDILASLSAEDIRRISSAQKAHWGKLYVIECATPRDYREFKRIASLSRRKYGQEIVAADGLPAWQAPRDESDFREVLDICKGVAQVVK